MSSRKQYSHAVIIFTAILFFSFSTSAIDLNSSSSMQYYSGNSLNFEVGTGGDVLMPGKATFTSSNIDFGPKLTVGSGDINIGDGAGDIDLNGNRIYNGGLAHFNSTGITDTLSNAQSNVGTLKDYSLYVAGDVSVGGDILGTGGDLAENIETEEKTLAPGTVATISGEMEVKASQETYDREVAGVVSTDPGVTLAKERDGVPLALSGIAPVNATVENGKIEPGDLMTTSGEKGQAMKCEYVSRCQGAIIGKAMEPLNQDGKVEIIVTLG